ncbi:MAG TPA: bifunctional phosphoribosyl-AMP cyclohydrolase/phosphoribosyl-ATP diphosphatase HisIE [Candidatus Eisenbacteria bacterium]|nr:bifunctional phosphoribosyl-AMP cyclohydrolase/phosphoribosyl-ATP diphosphatase HisIE [Candidatus Eisenbacteria bacterium]
MTAETRGSTSAPTVSAGPAAETVSAASAISEAAGSVASRSTVEPAAIRWDARGLVPVIVQGVADGRVLMLAYADREALAATLATGDVHFHSRSRDALWRKGETSGNVLRVVDLALDCDGDAILATVEPTGPTCHRGTRSCFDPKGAAGADEPQGFAWLETLSTTIAERARERPAGSYTTSLLEGGVDATARKVAEEATEVVLAAKDDAAAAGSGFDRSATRSALAGEAADLIYHLLVVLAERDVAPSEVIDVLRERHRA